MVMCNKGRSLHLHLSSNVVAAIVALAFPQPLFSLPMRRLRWTIHLLLVGPPGCSLLILPIRTLGKARLYSCHLPPRPILWTHL